MKSITFSHRGYEKFRRIGKTPPFTARLLQVFLVHAEDISSWFREYDTKYYTEKGTDYYPLQGRKWIVLKKSLRWDRVIHEWPGRFHV